MSDTPFRIITVSGALRMFQAAGEAAQRRGQGRVFAQAARWITEELTRTPTEFGESGTRWEWLGIDGRRGFAGPLYVDFGVDEVRRIVYIRRFGFSH